MEAKSATPSPREQINQEGIKAINEGRYLEGIATLMRSKVMRAYLTITLLEDGLAKTAADFEKDMTKDGEESPFTNIDQEALKAVLTDVLLKVVTTLAAEEVIARKEKQK